MIILFRLLAVRFLTVRLFTIQVFSNSGCLQSGCLQSEFFQKKLCLLDSCRKQSDYLWGPGPAYAYTTGWSSKIFAYIALLLTLKLKIPQT